MFINFTLMLLALIVGEGLYLWMLWQSEMKKLRADWEEAHSYSTAEEFVQKNRSWLQHLRLGFNISPETMEWASREMGQFTPSEVVTQMVTEFGLRAGRIGIRMNHCVNESGEISLEYYEPWFDELAKHSIDTYISLGFKVFRWPETHTPPWLLRKYYPQGIPSSGHVVTPEEEFGQYLLEEYYPQLCKKLIALAKKNNYPANIFYCIQPENEALSDFGELHWKLSKEFVLQAIAVVHQYFPRSLIMQNSPIVGGTFRSTNNVLIEALAKDKSLKGLLIAGVNNYYKQPHSVLFSMKVKGEKLFENLALASVTKQLTGDVTTELKRLKHHGIPVMTSELAMEPWQPYLTPGNEFHEYMFILLRNKRVLTIPHQGTVDALNWGMEEFVCNIQNELHPCRPHHQEMKSLMKQIAKFKN